MPMGISHGAASKLVTGGKQTANPEIETRVYGLQLEEVRMGIGRARPGVTRKGHINRGNFYGQPFYGYLFPSIRRSSYDQRPSARRSLTPKNDNFLIPRYFTAPYLMMRKAMLTLTVSKANGHWPGTWGSLLVAWYQNPA